MSSSFVERAKLNKLERFAPLDGSGSGSEEATLEGAASIGGERYQRSLTLFGLGWHLRCL